MRKILGFALALAVALFLGPAAYAQNHGSHGGSTAHGQAGHGAAHGQAGGHPAFRGEQHAHANAEARGHFNGRRFDRGWEGSHFGRFHSFVPYRSYWGGGWGFWYGSVWFGYDAWPYGWGAYDAVYIDYDPACDCYFMYNPLYPGVHVGVTAIF